MTETLSYTHFNYREQKVLSGRSITATWPNEVFVLVLSSPPEFVAPPEEEEVVEPAASEPGSNPAEPAEAEAATPAEGEASVDATADGEAGVGTAEGEG